MVKEAPNTKYPSKWVETSHKLTDQLVLGTRVFPLLGAFSFCGFLKSWLTIEVLINMRHTFIGVIVYYIHFPELIKYYRYLVLYIYRLSP